MNISLRGDKLEITESMKEYAKEKLGRLEKYIENPNTVDASILVKVRKQGHKVEVTIPLKKVILRAEETQENFYAAVDVVIDKLERQIRKNKTRIGKSKQKEEKDFIIDYIESMNDEEPSKIVKRKKVDVKPMDEEEAILQMELLGHEFYLFKNVETDSLALLYRRKDGNYGLIDAE